MSNYNQEIKNLAAEYKTIVSSAAKPAAAASSKYYTHAKASQVKLAKGANARALTADAENLLKAILAASNVFSTTYTSTLRTYDDQARILLQKTAAQVQSLGYYGGAADFITAFNKYKASSDRAGFAKYMQDRDAKRGRAISNHIPGYALDIPRNTSVNSFLSKNGSSIKGFSKFLDEPKNNCTHIEFTFLVCGQSNSTSGGGGSSATAPATSTPAANGAISASVGKGGKNVKADVKIVQTLLNKKGAKLDVDGSCGTNTINAIANFQKTVLKIAAPDGRVDVNGKTWKALNSSSAAPSPAAPAAPAAPTPSPVASPEPAASSSPSTTPDTKSSISASVGNGGQNVGADVKTVRTILVNTWKYKIAISEKSDTELVNAIKDFQSKKAGSSNPDGRVDKDGNTWKVLTGQKAAVVSSGKTADTSSAPGKAPAKTPHSEYAALAKQFGLEVATVYAIKEVESGGAGYLSDGRPKILFEGHIFWKQLQAVGINPSSKVSGNENIIYSKWDKSKYKGGTAEYDRLNKAMKIHREAALKSASWGEFQIMGFNHKAAGYADVDSFVTAIQTTGSANIKSMLGFCQSSNLLKHVGKGTKNWAAFAKGYNGPAYAQNKYDTKLANAYAKYKKEYPNE